MVAWIERMFNLNEVERIYKLLSLIITPWYQWSMTFQWKCHHLNGIWVCFEPLILLLISDEMPKFSALNSMKWNRIDWDVAVIPSKSSQRISIDWTTVVLAAHIVHCTEMEQCLSSQANNKISRFEYSLRAQLMIKSTSSSTINDYG